MNTIKSTNFNFNHQKSLYKGKVRDVYNINDELLVMVASDRISAFDVVLPRQIPYKGQVLNNIAVKFLHATKDIVPNWLINSPHPNVSIGHLCVPFKVEMVIRGYLSGHAWREYRDGKRTICGVSMPDGMKENDKFPKPLVTPTTKEDVGHDEDISREEILAQGLVTEEDYNYLESRTIKLFERGTEMAAKQGLILVDTKYEFGKTKDGKIVLIDEIHTPDSSRYFYLEGYQHRQDNNEKQKQLSKEFVREWLMENEFQGQEGQQIPNMSDDFINMVSNRYIELYEHIIGESFDRIDLSALELQIEKAVNDCLS